MSLSANESVKIENEEKIQSDTSSTSLKPNIAGLLCYLGGWVSGIIFLIIEQKNKFVRFHALQSIIVFGALFTASLVLRIIPVVGSYFCWALSVLSFALWLFLMVKANSGEVFKMPWAGNLAEDLTVEAMGKPSAQQINVSELDDSKQENFRSKYYSTKAKAGRLVGSAFIIAWSVILIVFFNFYNQYIAYYEHLPIAGVNHWQINTIITGDFNSWLPIVNTTLVLAIVGHILMIVFDKYLLNQIIQIILDIFGLATVITLLSIFPFDFSSIPNHDVAFGFQIGIIIALIGFTVGIAVGILVRFIQFIVNVARGTY